MNYTNRELKSNARLSFSWHIVCIEIDKFWEDDNNDRNVLNIERGLKQRFTYTRTHLYLIIYDADAVCFYIQSIYFIVMRSLDALVIIIINKIYRLNELCDSMTRYINIVTHKHAHRYHLENVYKQTKKPFARGRMINSIEK